MNSDVRQLIAEWLEDPALLPLRGVSTAWSDAVVAAVGFRGFTTDGRVTTLQALLCPEKVTETRIASASAIFRAAAAMKRAACVLSSI